MAAQDVIDSTGFHAMSTAINEAATIGDVSSRTKGNVEKALTVANAVSWPEELHEIEAVFASDAEALIAALDAADLDGAKTAVTAIHSSQHDLSHDAFVWLGSQEGEASGVTAVMAAQDIIDSTGFHAMSEAINEAATIGDVSSRTKGNVEKALTAANAVSCPE